MSGPMRWTPVEGRSCKGLWPGARRCSRDGRLDFPEVRLHTAFRDDPSGSPDGHSCRPSPPTLPTGRRPLASTVRPAAERLTDAREVGALDEQFHATLVRAAGNDEIARVHWDVTERIRIIRRLDFTRADRIDATYQEHGKILRSVIQRKVDQAQLLLRVHIEQSKAEVRKITLATLHDARRRA